MSLYTTACVRLRLMANSVRVVFASSRVLFVVNFAARLRHRELSIKTHVYIGCDFHRLRSFVDGFYVDAPQRVDDTFFAFVWTALLAQHPAVRLGVVPQSANPISRTVDVSTPSAPEVYVAPQPSKRARAKVKPGTEAAASETPAAMRLEPLPGTMRERAPTELLNEFGEVLRVAVDSQTIFVALTGSHLRVRSPPRIHPPNLLPNMLFPAYMRHASHLN